MSSCAIHDEATSNANQLQTQVVLNHNNYRVVGQAEGKCSQTYIFCIGGLNKKSLRSSAMSEMMKNANLTGSQALINVTVQYKNIFGLFVYGKCTAIARGTIIEFTE
ncbi:MAG: hypothetical protein LUE27_09465 [Clostridia bacterium]|nr:hypothetical protein [Clostridia bacterium]